MIVRCLVCIPTYNNAGSIAEVVSDVLAHTHLPVLILDDGSDRAVSELVSPHARVSIHRFEKNQGKGAAIQECFKLAIARNFTHIITIDGDGQHKGYDLPLFTKAITENPWSLIIGQRKFSGEHVPKSSQFGRKFSNFWVKYQTDQTVQDSQSGFRAYPLYFVQHLNFFTKKYDFEIEVLIRLIWKKVGVQEIAIDVYYPPAHERVSHFDKFWDNVKISLLNTALVVLSLLHSNTSRWRLVVSVMLGVFVGVIPVFGFHMYIGAFLSFIFRLNFPMMFLAQQISIPPLIPIWTLISLKIGSAITGQPLTINLDNALYEAERIIPTWFLGAAILGAVLAVIFGTLTWYKTRPRKQKQWTGKDRGGKFGNWFMKKSTDLFGPKLGYFFLGFICPYFYLFAPKAVKSHNQFFKISQPELGFFARQVAVIKTFYKLGQILIDNSYSNSKGADYFTSIAEGHDYPLAALSRKKGLVLAGAHMGAWMYATKAFGMESHYQDKMIINVIQFNVGEGQNSSNKIADDKVKYITKTNESPIFQIHEALNQNEVVIFMPDRLVDHNIELVLFFGKLAAVDVAPFKIAMAKKAAVAFSYAFKSGPREYLLVITDPIMPEDFSGVSKQEAIIKYALKFTESLETYMKRYPTQWFNFFPFWSSISSENLAEHSRESKSHLL
jgi:predicted LPLAT superfamily acyltransferase/glycosyltransferase involved in cell wall biosynthesis